MSVVTSVRHKDRTINHFWTTNRFQLEESYETFQYLINYKQNTVKHNSMILLRYILTFFSFSGMFRL
jgi:hypothetical protein